jgi:hypothetical protein
VPHPGQKNEHRILSKNSHLQNEKSIAWDEVLNDLKTIEAIIHSPDPPKEELLKDFV